MGNSDRNLEAKYFSGLLVECDVVHAISEKFNFSVVRCYFVWPVVAETTKFEPETNNRQVIW